MLNNARVVAGIAAKLAQGEQGRRRTLYRSQADRAAAQWSPTCGCTACVPQF